jgi:cytochrome c oxidase subunit 2
MPRRLRRAAVLLAVALLALTTISVASAQSGMPAAITKEGDKIHDLWVFTLIIALVVFVAVEGAILYALFAFRKKSDELPKQTHGSTIVEIIWTTIPVVIVVTLFAYSFVVLRDIENTAPDDVLTVHVQGFQYQWGFTYNMNDLGTNTPDRNAEGTIEILGTPAEEPTLYIPIDEPVEFTLFSADVIHSFYIRDFLYKLDVVPGRDNRFVVTAHTLGTFDAQCAELCGVNHALMRFKLEVMTREDFDKWVAENAPEATTSVQQAQ